MKIGILSDIHGYPEKFDKAFELFYDCDMVLCAGDILYHGPRNPILPGYNPKGLIEKIINNKIPMLIARGNCDAEVDLMVLNFPMFLPVVFYEKNGVRFMVLHGHDVDDEKLKEIAQFYDIKFMITGHTHIRKHECINGIHYINPGSVGVPKGDEIPSVVIIDENKIQFINIEDKSIIEEKVF
ncbi:MAG: phosphodiesterase [Caloramator sp.]|nr:phosphodiesterase [Caloramator sp.]